MQDEIVKRFSYHPPKEDQGERYQGIRDTALEFARVITYNTPVSREQSLALTNLEQVVMWANAALARNE